MKSKNKTTLNLKGIYPPLPTPFGKDGSISLQGLKKNLAYLEKFILRGYVVMGSNGEYVLLSEREKLQVMETVRSESDATKLVIAGTGCQSTAQTIDLSRQAAKLDIDAALVINPSYYRNQMSPDVLINHYFKVADASPIPLIIYNMPACTGIDMDAATIIHLASHDNIIGVKDSTGNVTKMGAILQQTGPDFQILAGSGGFLLPALSVGAIGGVLALANIAPLQSLSILEMFQEQRHRDAQQLQIKMVPVNSAITARWGVPGLKAALDFLGMVGGPVREPLVSLSGQTKQELFAILREGGITKED